MICSVSGSADGHELILERNDNGWQATLPPDLIDGQYVATLLATDEAGNSTTYRGVLYLCEGICRLEVQPEKLTLIMPTQGEPTAEILSPLFSIVQDNAAQFEVVLLPEMLQIQFVRHWRCR